MAFNNMQGYNAYRDTGIKTASQGKLVVMLYEAAVKSLDEALEKVDDSGKIEAKNIERFNACIQKTQQIINELQTSLNLDQGGQIAANLMSLYMYYNQQLLQATLKHDKKILQFIRTQLDELCSAWRSAAATSSNGPAYNSQRMTSLNITG